LAVDHDDKVPITKTLTVVNGITIKNKKVA